MTEVTTYIIRIVICAVCGAGAGIAGIYLTRLLLKQRSLEYRVTPIAEKIIVAAMAIPGGAIGAFTTGIALPICGMLMLCVCVTIAITDWYQRIIPNQTVLAILVLALAFGMPTMFGAYNFLKFDIIQSLIGLVVCFVVFALPGLFKKNVGAGDIKLAGAMGFFLGINYALVAIMLMGILVIVYGLFQRKMPILSFIKSQIPMGPFITLGLMSSFLLTYALPIS